MFVIIAPISDQITTFHKHNDDLDKCTHLGPNNHIQGAQTMFLMCTELGPNNHTPRAGTMFEMLETNNHIPRNHLDK